jgi:hypothetical protein
LEILYSRRRGKTMKNNANKIYKAPQAEMVIVSSRDVITQSNFAFFGEADLLVDEDPYAEEAISYSGYNVLCD